VILQFSCVSMLAIVVLIVHIHYTKSSETHVNYPKEGENYGSAITTHAGQNAGKPGTEERNEVKRKKFVLNGKKRIEIDGIDLEWLSGSRDRGRGSWRFKLSRIVRPWNWAADSFCLYGS